MIIGSLRIQLYIPLCNSLKQKRGIIKPILHLLKKKYNISIVELDHQDVLRNATFGIATISNSKVVIDQTFDSIFNDIDTFSEVEIIDHYIEIF